MGDIAEVTIIVKGGMVEQVSLPEGVLVTVIDYDAGGDKDAKGVTCSIITYEYEEQDDDGA